VIRISEKKPNHKKDVEDRLRREITSELKKKKERTRKITGLIISGVGGILYLIRMLFFGIGDQFLLFLTIPFLIVGAISEIGTIIAAFRVKIGGVVILTSIPISLVIGILLNFGPYWYYPLMVFLYLVLPFPFPHSVFVITGGILSLLSSDE
jgi:hypothetical protein